MGPKTNKILNFQIFQIFVVVDRAHSNKTKLITINLNIHYHIHFYLINTFRKLPVAQRHLSSTDRPPV